MEQQLGAAPVELERAENPIRLGDRPRRIKFSARSALQHPSPPPRLAAAAPLRALPEPLDLDQVRIGRHDRLGGILHEHTAVA